MLHVKRDADPLEKVIRPIVEGQIRGFLKEHPGVVAAVDWYKPRKDKATTFVNSLGKRIVLDLVCDLTKIRIEKALFELWENERNSGVACAGASESDRLGTPIEADSRSAVALGPAANTGLLGNSSEQAGSFHDWFGN